MCCWEALTTLRAENERLRAALRRRADTTTTPQYECKICMAAPIESVFLPCGHCLTCTRCARASKRCPVCDEAVRGLTQIYVG